MVVDCELTALDDKSGLGYCQTCDPNAERPIPLRARRNCRINTSIRKHKAPQQCLERLVGKRAIRTLTEFGIPHEWVNSMLGSDRDCGNCRQKASQLKKWSRKWRYGKYKRRGDAIDDLEKILVDCEPRKRRRKRSGKR